MQSYRTCCAPAHILLRGYICIAQMYSISVKTQILYSLQLVMVLFQSFDVEKSKDCRWDKLAIYEEGPSDSSKLGEFCGDNIPPTIASTKKLHIQFTSDTVIQSKGFKLQYLKTIASNESLCK